MKQSVGLKVNEDSCEGSLEPWEKLLKGIKDDIGLTNHLLQAHKGVSRFDVQTLGEASYLLQAYGEKGVKVISGGTDILRMMKQKYTPELPGVLVNMKTIPDLTYIKEETGIMKIGALTSLSDIENSELIRTKYSILAEAAGVVGSRQIRNMATMAGSICQDLGCWYYRADKNYYYCLRKGGMHCPAKAGDNRWMFSIFGTPKECECYATCQSDMAVTLSALGASVKTTDRIIPIEQFFIPTPPGNALRSDEMITEIQIPVFSTDTKSKYSKFSIRKSLDHPLVSVACVVSDKEVRVLLGGVFVTPHRASEVEDMIRGKKINEDLAEKAGEVAVENASSMSMNAWKVEVAKTMVKRTILALT